MCRHRLIIWDEAAQLTINITASLRSWRDFFFSGGAAISWRAKPLTRENSASYAGYITAEVINSSITIFKIYNSRHLRRGLAKLWLKMKLQTGMSKMIKRCRQIEVNSTIRKSVVCYNTLCCKTCSLSPIPSK